MKMPGFTAEASIYESTRCYSMASPVVPVIRGDGLVSMALPVSCYFDYDAQGWTCDGGGGGGPGGGPGTHCAPHWDPCDNGYQNFIGANCDIQMSRPC